MTTALHSDTAQESRWRRIQGPLLVAGAVLGASVLLHIRDPHVSGSWGLCPWLLLTGTSCPGCGGLRAVNDLARGNLMAAASSNVLFVSAIPLVVFLWGRWFTERWQGRPRRHVGSRRALMYAGAFLTVAIVFSVVRNTPGGAWLAP